MSTTGYSDVRMAEAAVAIQTTQAYRAGKGEQFLNTVGTRSRPRIYSPNVVY